MAEVLQVGKYGPIFELEPPHTVESVKAAVAQREAEGRRGLCRMKHFWRVVGKPYVPEDDLVTAALSLLASRSYNRLLRCRCGAVRMRGGL